VNRQRGFTLIEIMVAVVITAILAAMTFQAIQQAVENRTRIGQNAERLQALQFTLRSLVQDFSQATPRPVRESSGASYQSAVMSGAPVGVLVTLTRGGWMNPAGLERSTLQRVRYVLEDGKLRREYWNVLDAQLDPPPIPRVLLDKVKSVQLRYMSENFSWQNDWPPLTPGSTRTGTQLGWRPVAVEVIIELEDWGRINRIIEVPG
jgi:general secretion pathway protein J